MVFFYRYGKDEMSNHLIWRVGLGHCFKVKPSPDLTRVFFVKFEAKLSLLIKGVAPFVNQDEPPILRRARRSFSARTRVRRSLSISKHYQNMDGWDFVTWKEHGAV